MGKGEVLRTVRTKSGMGETEEAAKIRICELVDEFAVALELGAESGGAKRTVYGFTAGEPEFGHLETIFGVAKNAEVAESLTGWFMRKGGPNKAWSEEEFWQLAIPALIRITRESLRAKGHAPRTLQRAKDHSQVNPVAVFVANILQALESIRCKKEFSTMRTGQQSRDWLTRVRAYKRETLWKKFFRLYMCVKNSRCETLNLKENARMALVGAIKLGVEDCNTEGSLSRLVVCDIVVDAVLCASPDFIVQPNTLRIDQEDGIAGAMIRILTEREPVRRWPWHPDIDAEDGRPADSRAATCSDHGQRGSCCDEPALMPQAACRAMDQPTPSDYGTAGHGETKGFRFAGERAHVARDGNSEWSGAALADLESRLVAAGARLEGCW